MTPPVTAPGPRVRAVAPAARRSARRSGLRTRRSDRESAVSLWMAPALALLGGGVVPAVVLSAQPNVTGRSVWVPAVAVMAWSAIRLAGIIAAARPPLFQFTFYTFVYAYLGLAPLVQLRAGRFPITSPLVEPENVVTIWSLIASGIIAYEAGVFVARRRRVGVPDVDVDDADTGDRRRRGDDTAPVAESDPLRIHEGRTLVLVGVGIALSLLFIALVGLGPLLASRQDVQIALAAHFSDTSVSALVLAIGSGPLLVGVHALFRVRRRNIREGVTRRMTPLLVLAALVLVVAVNPISASRYSAGTVALSFVVLFGGLATVWRRRAVLLAVVVSFVLLLPSLALSRYSADNQYTGATPDGLLDNIRSSGDWDSFSSIGNAVHYVQGHGSTHGFQLLGSAAFWVPRSVWPTKPIDTGILLAQDRGYPMTNLSAPLWAEGYMNGGIAFVVALFFAFGLLSVVASARTWTALRSDGPWAIAGSIFAWYSFILLRGSLLQATGAAVLMLLCTVFVAERRRTPIEKGPPPS